MRTRFLSAILAGMVIITGLNLAALKNSKLLPPAAAKKIARRDIDHNCRMWAAAGIAFPDSTIYKQLIADANSLKHLADTGNVDGWGIAYYNSLGDTAVIRRGALRASADRRFDSTVIELNNSRPAIIAAHIRKCSAGCCFHNQDSNTDKNRYLSASMLFTPFIPTSSFQIFSK